MKKFALLLGVLVTVVLLGNVTFGAETGKITVCKKQLSDGTWVFKYPSPWSGKCGRAWITTTINGTGIQGPAGPEGPQGPQGVPGVRLNPLQVALLRWYEANTSGISFPVGNSPTGIAFDGANIWVTNWESNSVSKL